MTLEILMAFGSENNDWRLHQHNGISKTLTGWTFPTTTDDAASPPDGSRWIRADSTGVEFLALKDADAITPKTYQWICLHPVRVSGTLGVGEFGHFFRFAIGGISGWFTWNYVTSSTFNVTFRTGAAAGTLRGTSSSTFSTDTNLDIRTQLDGTRFKMWINGALEIDVAYTGTIANDSSYLQSPTVAGQEHYWGRGIIGQSDSESDRPDALVEMQELRGTSDYEDDYGDDADCGVGSTTGTYTDVNLDGSDEIDEATYWCEDQSEGEAQTSELDNPSAFSGTILCAYWHAAQRTGVEGKTITTSARIHDGTNFLEAVVPNLTTTITHRHHLFGTPPSGGTWEAIINSLKAGIKGSSSSGAADGVYAVVIEVYAVGNDPPVTENRRRVPAQVM